MTTAPAFWISDVRLNYDYGMTVSTMGDLFFGHSERQRAKTKHEMPSNVPLL